MITISKEELKKNNIPSVASGKISAEQARTIAQIIYHLLEAEQSEQENINVA